MVKPGMFISERYEIIEKVGSGGMADVYRAKCHRLNRYVGIKILKPEFSADKNLVTKRLPFIKVSDSLLRGKRRYE